MPIIYITDSNNACTLQQNARFKNKFTHRKMIRQVKQGINHAMANHLEYLTDKWPREEQLTRYTLELYKRGEEICKFWAKQIQDKLDTFSPFEHTHDETDSITSWESDTVSLESMSSISTNPTHNPTTSKNTFDSSMYDCLGRIIVVKVTSHQLHPDFTISNSTKGPIPCVFILSANQIADNAATQAQMLYENQHENLIDKCFYPPFSPRWNFSFEGYLINDLVSSMSLYAII
jgi:hypothetical protein